MQTSGGDILKRFLYSGACLERIKLLAGQFDPEIWNSKDPSSVCDELNPLISIIKDGPKANYTIIMSRIMIIIIVIIIIIIIVIIAIIIIIIIVN